MNSIKLKNKKIAVIGLGYVGLPIAIEFSKKQPVIGFDINKSRISELKDGNDSTLETTAQELKNVSNLIYTNDLEDIKSCQIFIITVPTPIDENKIPDLTFLKKSSKLLGKILKKNDVVIYESTVYPGATEEVCIPILEKYSGLILNKEFYCGYSPERINTGDKEHRLTNIKKITSGSTPEIATEIDELYKQIILAGTHKAKSIKVAEAAKVIENIQRDVNIALINELSIIFNKLNIETESVLEAAGTKWNFLPYRPGLVGGHCIGIDPYYLTYKAIEIGYNPEVILAGRRLNDKMGSYVADQVIKIMSNKNISVKEANILIMGLAFKENCPDIRNTKVIDLIEKFTNFNCKVDIYDPWVDSDNAKIEYNLKLISKPQPNKYDAIVIAVSHKDFKEMKINEIKTFGKQNCVIYDVKYVLKPSETDGRL